ncbi:hypothetical protein GCK72_000491 [Caenorhabditis remanei]|uniref:F-box associated domain-containing protein n=1 Tax=Caenorhabditis remanei TaxID=31234 RepID=A0A6A5HLB1_CAERE|nr:hypothetical protein GCK72_000491 [Caenorhabditis remanei]KAF1768678.1 hypothetical protein GCK72_000491 [Caenorhabditis remanei]
MTNKLSYPGLKCVLEYLEANRRIHITARSPDLRRIEKSIPIHLKIVEIEEGNIWLNYIQMSPSHCNEIEFKRGIKCYKWCYPMNLEFEKAKEKVREYYLGGRMNIYANHFGVSNREVESFPKFNVTTNEMTVYDCLLDDIVQYINPNSFPLEELTVECYDELNHPHVCSAKKLCIELSDEQRNEYSTRINAIQNKNAELEYDTLEWTDVMGLIRYWMENEKETGTTIVCKGYHHGNSNDWIATKLRNEFSEILSELTGVNDQYPNGTPGFSIPLTSTSKILVYGRKYSEIFYEEIVLKVVSSQAEDSTMEMEHQ